MGEETGTGTSTTGTDTSAGAGTTTESSNGSFNHNVNGEGEGESVDFAALAESRRMSMVESSNKASAGGARRMSAVAVAVNWFTKQTEWLAGKRVNDQREKEEKEKEEEREKEREKDIHLKELTKELEDDDRLLMSDSQKAKRTSSLAADAALKLEQSLTAKRDRSRHSLIDKLDKRRASTSPTKSPNPNTGPKPTNHNYPNGVNTAGVEGDESGDGNDDGLHIDTDTDTGAQGDLDLEEGEESDSPFAHKAKNRQRRPSVSMRERAKDSAYEVDKDVEDDEVDADGGNGESSEYGESGKETQMPASIEEGDEGEGEEAAKEEGDKEEENDKTEKSEVSEKSEKSSGSKKKKKKGRRGSSFKNSMKKPSTKSVTNPTLDASFKHTAAQKRLETGGKDLDGKTTPVHTPSQSNASSMVDINSNSNSSSVVNTPNSPLLPDGFESLTPANAATAALISQALGEAFTPNNPNNNTNPTNRSRPGSSSSVRSSGSAFGQTGSTFGNSAELVLEDSDRYVIVLSEKGLTCSCLEDYSSVMLLSYYIASGALGSHADLFLLYPTTTLALALHNAIIL